VGNNGERAQCVKGQEEKCAHAIQRKSFYILVFQIRLLVPVENEKFVCAELAVNDEKKSKTCKRNPIPSFCSKHF